MPRISVENERLEVVLPRVLLERIREIAGAGQLNRWVVSALAKTAKIPVEMQRRGRPRKTHSG